MCYHMQAQNDMRSRMAAGYMVSRMLGAAPVLADAIVESLCSASDRASDSHHPLGARTASEAEQLSASVWHAIWPVERCVLHSLPSSACFALSLAAVCGTVCQQRLAAEFAGYIKPVLTACRGAVRAGRAQGFPTVALSCPHRHAAGFWHQPAGIVTAF